MSISRIFSEKGEEYFRQCELETIKKISLCHQSVISTGGGVVENEKNYRLLKSNALIIRLKRKLFYKNTDNRPLAKDERTLIEIDAKRDKYYDDFADYTIYNDDYVDKTVKEIINIYENFSD